MLHLFRAVEEYEPGSKWQGLFRNAWPHYRKWFLREGNEARPTYLAGRRALKRYMPELLGTYDFLVEQAGGGDTAARFLSLYRPTPYLTGCSQAVWTKSRDRFLVRNYDYAPRLWEGVLLRSRWNSRDVIAMTDCVWGVLDGISEAGLTVSLAFGGRKVVGDGFGIPLVLRYALEFCDTTAEVVQALRRIPSHMAYNVTALDRRGVFKTIHVSPDRTPEITNYRVATNHQRWIEWTEYARATGSAERETFLQERLRDERETADRFVQRFLEPPLFSKQFRAGWGTLYTVVYHPERGQVDIRWPGSTITQSFTAFHEVEQTIQYQSPPRDASHTPLETGAE